MYYLAALQALLATYVVLDKGIACIERNNIKKAFLYFMIWFVYLVALVTCMLKYLK